MLQNINVLSEFCSFKQFIKESWQKMYHGFHQNIKQHVFCQDAFGENESRTQVQEEVFLLLIKWNKNEQKLVMWHLTRGFEDCIKENETSHIEALYRSLISFAKSTWSMTSEASFTWTPRDWFNICFKRSEPQRSFLYIIMRLHCFIFILIYILRSNELCPWNNSLRTEAELTLTDHRFNSWVYVWFI